MMRSSLTALSTLFLAATAGSLVACEDRIDLDPLDETPPVEARVRPMPISGGTLHATADGLAIAADPERDLVHIVDVGDRTVLHTITLQPGDEPGRVADGGGDRAYVVLRGFGGIATIDRTAGTVLERRPVCPDPRGVAYESVEDSMFVACADGTVVRFAAETGEELGRTVLEADLRDVVLAGGRAYASVFRAAALTSTDGRRIETPGNEHHEPHVAWRTVHRPGGGIAMLHQVESKEIIEIEPAPEDIEEGNPLYGGGDDVFFCEPGLATTAVSLFDEDGIWTKTSLVPNASLAVDMALSPDGEWVALATPGAEPGTPSVHFTAEGENGCFVESNDFDYGQVTAVAFLPDGALVMQTREPPRILVQSSVPFGTIEVVELEGETRFDTGHEIFHRTTESGLACASCHPEGMDDGHTWRFSRIGDRRTQPLDIGLAGTAPFHWDGDMADVDMLMDEVLSHRMGGKRHSPDRRDSFKRWMFEQVRPPADAGRDDPAAVAAGQGLFDTYACGRCHDGERLGGSRTESIRGKDLQVPPLRRVALRAPFMHDGRAATLEDAVRDMIESTTAANPTDLEIEALSAYMRTL
jgi:mono/diheme cytochrome c family protein